MNYINALVKAASFSLLCLLSFAGLSQTSEIAKVNIRSSLHEIAKLPKHIREASGLEITNDKKTLWTHNDGGLPMLYCIDTAGNVLKTIQLNHPNSGWEDLAVDKNGNLYVGAFGNNGNDKKELKIYKIPTPDSVTEKVVSAGIIKYKYADQHAYPPPPHARNFDMDAFIAMGDSLFLFSKNRTEPFTGYTRIYKLSQQPGEQIAIPTDSIFLGNGPMMDHWVTAADVSPDGKVLALLSHACMWLITDFHPGKFSTGKVRRLDFGHLSHKAGVVFKTSTRLYIVDELEFGILGGKLYSVDLSESSGSH